LIYFGLTIFAIFLVFLLAVTAASRGFTFNFFQSVDGAVAPGNPAVLNYATAALPTFTVFARPAGLTLNG
jgi:hypothetical protein